MAAHGDAAPARADPGTVWSLLIAVLYSMEIQKTRPMLEERWGGLLCMCLYALGASAYCRIGTRWRQSYRYL
jgi:hypothetical protein